MHCAFLHLNSTYSVFIFWIATTVIVNIAASYYPKESHWFQTIYFMDIFQTLNSRKKTMYGFWKKKFFFFFQYRGPIAAAGYCHTKSKRPNTKYTYIGEKQCRSSNAKIPRTVAPPTAPPPCLKMATTRRSITSHDWSIKCIWWVHWLHKSSSKCSSISRFSSQTSI